MSGHRGTVGLIILATLNLVAAAVVGLAVNVASEQQPWPGPLHLARRHPWWAISILTAVSVLSVAVAIAIERRSVATTSKTNEEKTGDEPRESEDASSDMAHATSPSTTLDLWQRYAIVDHDKLFGVDRFVADVAQVVRATHGGISLLSLFGDGGIGKTTIAFEVARRVTNEDFSRIAWASAKNTRFGESAPMSIQSGVQSADMLKAIADQLGFDVGLSRALWEQEFAAQLRGLGSNERVLAVIDNIESLGDASSLPQYLESLGLIRPHKVLVTTRWSLQKHSAAVDEFPVRSLDPSDALALALHLGRNDPSLSGASVDTLAPLLRVTDGNPFLIKITVKHYLMTHRSLDQVLHELTDLSAGGSGFGQQVREHLYLRSLAELDRRHGKGPARSLMSAFCATDIGDSLSYEELADVSGLGHTDEFRTLLEDACSLALIRASELNSKYSIHSLLYEFTCRHI